MVGFAKLDSWAFNVADGTIKRAETRSVNLFRMVILLKNTWQGSCQRESEYCRFNRIFILFIPVIDKLISLLGIACLIGLAWGLSSDKKRFPFRAVISGLLLQITFALFILKTPPGLAFFSWAREMALKVLGFAKDGAQSVFGPLAQPEILSNIFGAENAFIMAVPLFSTIVFVSAISSLLFHWGIIQKVVYALAWVMQSSMRTSGSESLASAANVFMGQTEAPLVVKPYLSGMTRSELMSLMTGGMATIAGSVFAIYVALGMDAGHLITASVLSAPGALLVAKIMIPETSASQTSAGAKLALDRRSVNSIDALCLGAKEGIMLTLNVLAMLIAFIATIGLANFIISSIVSPLFGSSPTIQQIIGYTQVPFAWLIGVPTQDCLTVAEAMGNRIVFNEFLGYQALSQSASEISERGQILATYALCGFANFGSIAIQIGGIGHLAPDRHVDLAKLGVRSMIGGLITCYLTASIVGLFV